MNSNNARQGAAEAGVKTKSTAQTTLSAAYAKTADAQSTTQLPFAGGAGDAARPGPPGCGVSLASTGSCTQPSQHQQHLSGQACVALLPARHLTWLRIQTHQAGAKE